MIALIKRHPGLCSLACIEQSGAVGDAVSPTHLYYPRDRSSGLLEKPNHPSSSNYHWWTTFFSLSHAAPFRARKKKKKTERKGRLRMWWQANAASMKTVSELGTPSAWLILTTYTRIKKHLLTKSHVWINHRALVKGTMSFLSSQSWQFSLKRQMSSEWKKANRSAITWGNFSDSPEDSLCLPLRHQDKL